MSASPNIVGVHYKVGRKIGEGSFGVIYEGTNLLNNTLVAIKFESRKSEAPQLRDEFRTYKILAGCEGIPLSYYFGQEGLHNILVIDLLGPSLEDMFDMCGRKFSIKSTCMLAKAMISRIWSVHEKSLIYRDIKPDNFLIGRPGTKNQNVVYMVDFGMAKHYRDPKSKQHIPYRERKSLSGTARYMSINTHLGREQSRRDDLEALGHVFFYFLRGSLPWQGLKANTNKQKYEKIGEKKQMTPVSELSERCPAEFADYLTYARKLGFEEEPDYRYLLRLMDQCMERHGLVADGVFDWLSTDQWNQMISSGRYGSTTTPNTGTPVVPATNNNVNHHNHQQPLTTPMVNSSGIQNNSGILYGPNMSPPITGGTVTSHHHHHHHHNLLVSNGDTSPNTTNNNPYIGHHPSNSKHGRQNHHNQSGISNNNNTVNTTATIPGTSGLGGSGGIGGNSSRPHDNLIDPSSTMAVNGLQSAHTNPDSPHHRKVSIWRRIFCCGPSSTTHDP